MNSKVILKINCANLSDKLLCLDGQIFNTFPQNVTSLKYYTLGCGCIYYIRILANGDLGSHVCIYRNDENGSCEICMDFESAWEGRIIDDVVVFNKMLQVELY